MATAVLRWRRAVRWRRASPPPRRYRICTVANRLPALCGYGDAVPGRWARGGVHRHAAHRGASRGTGCEQHVVQGNQLPDICGAATRRSRCETAATSTEPSGSAAGAGPSLPRPAAPHAHENPTVSIDVTDGSGRARAGCHTVQRGRGTEEGPATPPPPRAMTRGARGAHRRAAVTTASQCARPRARTGGPARRGRVHRVIERAPPTS